MDSVQMPPTSTIMAATEALYDTVSRFLSARDTIPNGGSWEAIDEAHLMMGLAARNLEGVIELARRDLVLLPGAIVMARTCFETGTAVRWLLNPDDPFEREMRWLRTIKVQEKFYRDSVAVMSSFGGDLPGFKEMADTLKNFHNDVADKLPIAYKQRYRPKPLPNMRQMLQSLGQEQMYLQYILMSQYAHGTQAATQLYRRGLGTMKEFGEFIELSSWRGCLTLCWHTLYHAGRTFLEKSGGDPDSFAPESLVREMTELLRAVG